MSFIDLYPTFASYTYLTTIHSFCDPAMDHPYVTLSVDQSFCLSVRQSGETVENFQNWLYEFLYGRITILWQLYMFFLLLEDMETCFSCCYK